MSEPQANSGNFFAQAAELLQAGRSDEAEKIYRKILNEFADSGSVAIASFQLGLIYTQKIQFDEASDYYLKAIAAYPKLKEAYLNLGTVYVQQGKYKLAESIYQNALEIYADDLDFITHLGFLYVTSGQLDKAISQYKIAVSIAPFDMRMYTNLLMAMVYNSSISPGELTETAKNFGLKIADPLLRNRPLQNEKTKKKIRIGYVSPDFRHHPVSHFISGLLTHHDRKDFEIFGYCSNTYSDHMTYHFQKVFDHWRDISAQNDDQAADVIEADKIDILIDMSGHGAGNRLLLFARKPAPVQVTWLGFPATTGMKAMDYRITDPRAEPEGMTEHLNAEGLWRLPDIFACYAPPENKIEITSQSAFEKNGFITFGCFNSFAKVNDKVLQVWSRIINRVLNSRLLLEVEGIERSLYRLDVEKRLKEAGIDIEKVILEPRVSSNQFILYNRIDIALDPFPCVGGTTSFDTLWMGVPFVTLAGNHFASRMGVSILKNASLPELIANTQDEYIEIAVSLANDKERLKNLRNSLRERVQLSPLMDQERFTRNLEAAYTEMWRRYCES